MNRKPTADENGFTLVETLIVMAVIGILASIAVPHYAVNREQARAATCLANRRTIEHDEAAHYAQNQSPSLAIATTYRCPEGGTYVWLVSDPEDPDYPKVGCSIHYAGGLETTEPTEPSATEETTPPAPNEAMDSLADDVRRLSLPTNVEKTLLNKIKAALNRYEKEKFNKAVTSLEQFKNQVKKNGKKIDDADEDYLISKAEEIQNVLRKL